MKKFLFQILVMAAALILPMLLSAQSKITVYKSLPANYHPGSMSFAKNGDVFVASMTTGEVLKFTTASAAPVVFVGKDRKLGSAMGVKVDEDRGILWLCSADLGLNAGAPHPGSYLNAFNLKTGALIAKYPLPDGGLANDLAIAPNGDIYVTDSKNPRLLLLKSGNTSLVPAITDPIFAPGDGFGLDGIIFLDTDRLVVSKFSEGRLFEISGVSGTPAIHPIMLDRALTNSDALFFTGGNSFLLAEPDLLGTNGKVLSISLADDYKATITDLFTGLAMPVNAVSYHNTVYFVEAQLAPLLIPSRKQDQLIPFAIKSIQQ